MAVGSRFVKWGLGPFIFGVCLSFGVIAHYCVGSRWPNGELFMKNITLWWACPCTLLVVAVVRARVPSERIPNDTYRLPNVERMTAATVGREGMST